MLIRYRISARYFYPRSPCGERPKNHASNCTSSQCISIHALLAESDPGENLVNSISLIFLSTLSLRRATSADCNYRNGYPHFYPRSPCGERLVGVAQGANFGDISIHALLAESDTWARGSRVTYVEFLSTLSLRRATYWSCVPLVGRSHFYPRSPCGERLTAQWKKVKYTTLFLSTLSLRRATDYYAIRCQRDYDFYPRSPCGERPFIIPARSQ